MSKLRTVISLVVVMAAAGASDIRSQEFREWNVKWRDLAPLTTVSVPRDHVRSGFDARLGDDAVSITLEPRAETMKSAWVTTIIAPVLNLKSGLNALTPLAAANELRYAEMMESRKLRAEPLPMRLSISIRIVSACVDSDGCIYFQAQTQFVRGNAITKSADTELWRFDGDAFTLLMLPSKWSEGG